MLRGEEEEEFLLEENVFQRAEIYQVRDNLVFMDDGRRCFPLKLHPEQNPAPEFESEVTRLV